MERLRENLKAMIKKSLYSLDCVGKDFTNNSEIEVTTQQSSNPSKKFNGGDYSFYTIYTPLYKAWGCDLEKSQFKVKYDTSSEFPFCAVRGIFTNTDDDFDGDYQTITGAELLLELELHKNNGCKIVHSYFEKKWDEV